jgi:hypothetical protein
MTDDQIIRARRIFSGRAFMVRTDVECVGGRRLRYRFEVRRADRRLSSLRWQIGSAPVLIRADDGPVYSFVPNLNATNIVELFAPDVPDAVDGFRNDYRVLARGRLGLMTESRNAAILLAISSRVRVTIHMITGDAFVEFDQGVGPVQSIIRACGIDADAVRQSVAALANRAEPPQQADSTQPYESENTPPEDSAGSEEGAPGDPEESRPDKRDRV